MPTNVMIYGSAVSRTAFGVMDSSFSLLRHVAGQSMISALSRPGVLGEGRRVEPALEEDVKSMLLKHVRRHAGELDVLVIDLLDERHGVVHLPDGSYVTDTPELSAAGLLDTVAGKKTTIAPVTERHWDLWEASANRLFSALAELGLRERTIVLDMPWAKDEREVGGSRDGKAAELSAYFTECCAHIRSRGFTVAAMPEGPHVVATEHNPQWETPSSGAVANSWIASQIEAVAARTS
ncbi:DUF6270 domain-containing protein [Pseudarthrobacter sp. PH31-O2]|uniref:DUF6270 domain-containing protein n=1 Tax=Pseudarthrobacter sp. PH31-O2 TaxID=3046206 RepID=UPI0024BBD09F|nr:DUF6270 domain-containing protein [Pseudarthrobacter sp. PH31-O2]MDJ0351351.1 DUF6270 domain-containing protein [Pseudarthrobacter sp. PH31-O2]